MYFMSIVTRKTLAIALRVLLTFLSASLMIVVFKENQGKYKLCVYVLRFYGTHWYSRVVVLRL